MRAIFLLSSGKDLLKHSERNSGPGASFKISGCCDYQVRGSGGTFIASGICVMMRPSRSSPAIDIFHRARPDVLWIGRQLYLLLALPLVVVVVIVFCGQSERQPPWDTGFIDKVDEDLFRKAMTSPEDAIISQMPPKIAFLFLVRGSLPLIPVWERFFKGHEGRYSVYVHASTPGFSLDDAINSTAFKGRQVPSVPIIWGGPNMIKAERRLLAAALGDPANQRFVLLSESCLPIFNFTHVFDYLFSTNSSFITSHDSAWRYRYSMAPLIKKKEFRKGSQWFTLVRKHAMLVVQDEVFYQKFLETAAEIPDESYIQTIVPLADSKNVERRSVEFVHWLSSSARHPTSFGREAVTEKFIRGIQESRRPPTETIGFLRMSKSEPCTVNGQPRHCFLFARKFDTSSIQSFFELSHVLGY